MISPDDIKTTALKWWREVLQNEINESHFFPKTLPRIGKVKPGETIHNFDQIQQAINALRKHSKEHVGHGYTVIWSESNNRKTGRNQLPSGIAIDSLDDYLILLKKEDEFKKFQYLSNLIVGEFPELKGWILREPVEIISWSNEWADILKVCRYFKTNPRPNLYIRQLVIDIPTKFIEQRASLISSLLEFIIPDHINRSESGFAERHNLLLDQPTVRVRFLDEEKKFHSEADICLPLNRFKHLNFDCRRIVITENKMNFLTLPELKNTIAVWSGGGFNVKYLADIPWIQNKEIYYWGDLDTHGFHILNQIRNYYRHTISIMMDQNTFSTFIDQSGKGSATHNTHLPFLTSDEKEMYLHLKVNDLRLEQEKIRHDFVHAFFESVFNRQQPL